MSLEIRFEANAQSVAGAALVVFVGTGSHLSAGARFVDVASGGQLGRAMKAAKPDLPKRKAALAKGRAKA
jgi:hypothetical protein